VLALFNFSFGFSYCIAATTSENIQTKAALEEARKVARKIIY
jgi:hypothetical protein